MRAKEKEQIAELKTHVLYIREHIKEINKKMASVEKQGEEVEVLKTSLTNHLQMHKRDWAKVALFVTIITSAVSIVISLVM